MSFDLAEFRRAKFEPRTAEVKVSALAGFFSDGEEPIFLVRGLEAAELQRCLEAKEKQEKIADVITQIAENAEAAQKMKEISGGLHKQTPAEVVKGIEMLTVGCVSPELTRTDSVKIAQVSAVEFLILYRRIATLTGEGYSLVKPEAASQVIAV